MPTRCTVCAHPDLTTIDAALLNGSSERSVAKASGLSPAAVHRHVANGHVSELLTSVTKQVEAVGHSQLVAEAVGLYERSLALLTEAEHAKMPELRIKALGQVRGNLEILAKLALSAPPTTLGAGERPDLDAAIAAHLGHAAPHAETPPHEQHQDDEPKVNHTSPQHPPLALPPGDC